MRNPNEIKINDQTLAEIIELHSKWVFDRPGGSRADLSRADLRGADLRDAEQEMNQ